MGEDVSDLVRGLERPQERPSRKRPGKRRGRRGSREERRMRLQERRSRREESWRPSLASSLVPRVAASRLPVSPPIEWGILGGRFRKVS